MKKSIFEVDDFCARSPINFLVSTRIPPEVLQALPVFYCGPMLTKWGSMFSYAIILDLTEQANLSFLTEHNDLSSVYFKADTDQLHHMQHL